MKLNKHTYVDIVEKNVETQYTFKSDLYYRTVLGYKVNIITEYDIKLFGKIFHKSKTKELPFLFRTLEMAKDFCEINPKYEKVYFQDREDGTCVRFYTYQLVVNKSIIGYIWWHNESVIIDHTGNMNMTFNFSHNSIVYGFVKNIELDNWVNTNYLSDVRYYGFTTKLSELVKPIINTTDTEKHWRFELIENK